jgi:hypothetical protein
VRGRSRQGGAEKKRVKLWECRVIGGYREVKTRTDAEPGEINEWTGGFASEAASIASGIAAPPN